MAFRSAIGYLSNTIEGGHPLNKLLLTACVCEHSDETEQQLEALNRYKTKEQVRLLVAGGDMQCLDTTVDWDNNLMPRGPLYFADRGDKLFEPEVLHLKLTIRDGYPTMQYEEDQYNLFAEVRKCRHLYTYNCNPDDFPEDIRETINTWYVTDFDQIRFTKNIRECFPERFVDGGSF